MGNKKLLITTQILDTQDPILGFFHEWVKKFASHYESVTVICLKKGGYDLPKNVKVFSLGKEEGQSRVKYIYRFFKYAFRVGHYDSVFVHMNEEYVLLAGWLWRLFGKRVSLWRNHKQGTWRTRVAVFFAHTVFFTSPDSYTAHFKKAVQMPVGIDTDRFYDSGTQKKEKALLYVGRISRVKNIECLIDAVALLKKENLYCSLDIFGPILDKEYHQSLIAQIENRNLSSQVVFYGAASPEELPLIYQKYEVCLNMTDSGSLDKTIFESILCGAFPVVANMSIEPLVPERYKSLVFFETDNPTSMAHTLRRVLESSETNRVDCVYELGRVIKEKHGLSTLMEKIYQYI